MLSVSSLLMHLPIVRQKAKDITSLLMDEQRLKEERRSRNQMQERMAGVGDYMNDVMGVGRSNGSGGEDHAVYRHPGYMDEDKDLKKAIEESKRMAEQEFRNRGEGYVQTYSHNVSLLKLVYL